MRVTVPDPGSSFLKPLALRNHGSLLADATPPMIKANGELLGPLYQQALKLFFQFTLHSTRTLEDVIDL